MSRDTITVVMKEIVMSDDNIIVITWVVQGAWVQYCNCRRPSRSKRLTFPIIISIYYVICSIYSIYAVVIMSLYQIIALSHQCEWWVLFLIYKLSCRLLIHFHPTRR